jgi:D-aminoacyl-tRNA deacylase
MPDIIIAKGNDASENIQRKLIENFGFRETGQGKWARGSARMHALEGRIVDIAPPFTSDCFIYASTHKSETNTKSLTVHVPGNWGAAEVGGSPSTLNVVDACRMKVMLREIARLAGERKLDWQVCMEVDHHGPTIGSPIIFAEIGSTSAEWKNDVAGEIIAEAIVKGAESREKFPCVLGAGGGHYAPAFSSMMLNSEHAVGHILPKYRAAEANLEVFRQAVGKNVDTPGECLIDWKGLNQEMREKVISFCKECGIEWRKI